jgi:DNA ligase (NAD+)
MMALGINPVSDNYAPQPMAAVAGAGAPLAGTTWVITGTLSQPRESFADRIRAAGGKVSGSVSAKTSWLLAGSEAGSKLEKAESLKVPVLDEAGFEALFSQHAAEPAPARRASEAAVVQPDLF